jgi:hypothetical protein
MWAVVLVPMWLHRDAAREVRSRARFRAAMRTLSFRTSGSAGHRYVVMPKRSAPTRVAHVSGPPAQRGRGLRTALGRRWRGLLGRSPRLHRTRLPLAPNQPRVERARRLTRRRRLLAGTGLAMLLSALLVAVGRFPLAGQLLLDAAFVGLLVYLRLAARRRTPQARSTRRPARARAAAPVPAEVGEAPAVADSPPAAAGEEPPELSATGTEGRAWQPVPVPPPTYTLKPPAPQRSQPRFPELEPEHETMEPDEMFEPVALLDKAPERRRAVGD